MKAILQAEIDDALIEQMAMFLLSNSVQGSMPAWYRMFIVAQKLNAPVWDVERALSENGEALTPKREWAVRALTLSFAEAEAERLRQEGLRKPQSRVIRAFGG